MFDHDVEKTNTFFVVLLILLIVICIIGNILVCIAFLCYRRLRVITHYYIFSLAISDLLVGVISMPIWLNYELTGWGDHIDFTLVNIMDFIEILTCISSVMNLAMISIDRFFGIVKPLQHKTFVTEKIAVLFILAAWLYSFIIAGIKMVPTFMDYFLFCFVTGYTVPIVVTCVCYFFIFTTVKKHAKRRLSNQLSKERTLAKTITVVISLFVACWTPFFVVTLLYQYCSTCTFIEKPWFEYLLSAIKALHYLNSACNPFIYGVCNMNFRTAYKSIVYRFLSIFYKDYEVNPYETSLVGRYSSVRQRSNTINSTVSYSESLRSPACSNSSTETDDSQNNDKLQRKLAFQRICSSSNSNINTKHIQNALKPAWPTEEPRLLLRQKFQKQLSLEQQQQQNPLVNNNDKFFEKISQTFNNTAKNTGKVCGKYQQISSNCLESGNENIVNDIQSKTLVEIGTLLADSKESNI